MTDNRTSNSLLDIVREVSTMDCFYTGAKCPPACQCLSARAERAFHEPPQSLRRPQGECPNGDYEQTDASNRGNIGGSPALSEPPSDAHPDTLLLNAFPGVREELQHVLRNRTTLTKGASDAG